MWFQATRFLRHWFNAQTRFAVQSPFVYDFVTKVLPHQGSEVGTRIDAHRRKMSREKTTVEIRDFGAGYGGDGQNSRQKTIGQVVASSARRRRSGELLHRICKHYQPGTCLEFGANLGYSTLYQVTACPKSRFLSMEGAPELAEIAANNFEKFGVKVDLRVGEFEASLKKILSEEIYFDHVLLDGNHRRDATVNYFETLENRMNPNSIIIVDDINWSHGMQEAWKHIKGRKSVSVSVDLYWMGICFMHRRQAKEAFRFRFRP